VFSSEFPPTPFKFRRYSFELRKLPNRLELLAESHVFEFNLNLTHISEDKKHFLMVLTLIPVYLNLKRAKISPGA